MKCGTCGGEMVERKASVQAPYQYRASGLDDVFLAGISVFECPSCGNVVPAIPKINELHHVISENLISKNGHLNGREVRFLRKNAGFSSADFSALIGVSAAHLSRVENGHLPLTETVEKLTRAIVAVVAKEPKVQEILLHHASKLNAKRKLKVLERKTYRLNKGQWLSLAA